MDLNDVKACLRGLLSSTNKYYYLTELLEDFKELVGMDLPLFGFGNSIEFLQSIPDTVQVKKKRIKLRGQFPNPDIFLTESEKSAHITSLVKRQRQGKEDLKFRMPRTKVGLHKNKSENGRNSEGNQSSPMLELKIESPVPKNGRSHSKTDVQFNESENIDYINCLSDNLSYCSSRFSNMSIDDFDETNFESSTDLINDNIKNKLRKLIKLYPDGIWCCDLPIAFATQFNYDLDYREFGYTSLIHMLSELPDVFRCIRPGLDDWILFDASIPPSNKEKIYFHSVPNLLEENYVSSDDFPEDVVRLEDELSDIDLNRYVVIGKRLEVCATEVWSPTEFFVHLKEFKNRFNRFMDDLQKFYNVHFKKYKMSEAAIKPNQLCVAFYASNSSSPEEWHRARIINVLGKRMVTVRLVDFGTTVVLKKSHLRFLHRVFQQVPVQSVSASLAGVAPLNENGKWSAFVCVRFLELLRTPYLEAEVVCIDNGAKPRLNLILYHSFDKEGPSLNRKFVDENLARLEGFVLVSREEKNDESFSEKEKFESITSPDDGSNKDSFELEDGLDYSFSLSSSFAQFD